MKNKFSIIPLIILGLILTSCKDKVSEQPLIPISQKALKDTSSRFYADFKSYPQERNTLPIGVFDSGTGGLTVMEVLLTLDNFDNITGNVASDGIADFAGEKFIYLADDANMPYGDYDAMGKSDYLRELVVKDALFLLGDNYYNLSIDETPTGVKEKVKILVIACNTATAYGLNDIERLLEKSGTGIKVIGVINAGARAVLSDIDKKSNHAFGVLATPGTIASGAYERTIKSIAAQNGFSGEIQVINQSGAGFANAVDGVSDYVLADATAPRQEYRGPKLGKEDGDIDPSILDRYNFDFSNNGMLFTMADGHYTELQINSAANYSRYHLVSLIEKHRKSGSKTPLSAVILGCTHYPFLIETLSLVIDELRNYERDGIHLYQNVIAKDFRFIDPAQYTAIECYELLRKENQLAYSPEKSTLRPFISVPSYGLPQECLNSDGTLKYEYKYGRNIGTEDITTKPVPFSSRYIDEATQERMRRLVPQSFKLIEETL